MYRVQGKIMFHIHKWKYINVYPYRDTSFGTGVPSIMYTKQCVKCGKLEKGYSYGSTATLEDLNRYLEENE